MCPYVNHYGLTRENVGGHGGSKPWTVVYEHAPHKLSRLFKKLEKAQVWGVGDNSLLRVAVNFLSGTFRWCEMAPPRKYT